MKIEPTQRNWAIYSLAGALVFWLGLCAVLLWPALWRPFWFDEVYTAIASAAPLSASMDEIRADGHPPFFNLALAAFRALPGMDQPAHLGRLFNVLMMIPMAAALIRLGRVRGAGAGLVAALLIVTSLFWARYLVEMRSNFATMSLSVVVLVTLLIAPTRASERWGLITAFLLSGVHFFGTALAVSTLSVAALAKWRRGEPLAGPLATLAAILALFVFWAGVGSTQVWGMLTEGFWIQLNWATYRQALELSEPAVIGLIALGALAAVRRRAVPEVWPILAVGGLVLAGTYAISLIQPIVLPRNLIVLLPVVALAASLIHVQVRPGPWFAALPLAIGLAGLPDVAGLRLTGENADFLVAEAYGPECAGAPVYTFGRTLSYYAEINRAYGVQARPIAVEIDDIIAALRAPDWPAACRVAGYQYHSRTLPDVFVATLAAQGIAVVSHVAPVREGIPPPWGGMVFALAGAD